MNWRFSCSKLKLKLQTEAFQALGLFYASCTVGVWQHPECLVRLSITTTTSTATTLPHSRKSAMKTMGAPLYQRWLHRAPRHPKVCHSFLLNFTNGRKVTTVGYFLGAVSGHKSEDALYWTSSEYSWDRAMRSWHRQLIGRGLVEFSIGLHERR